MQIVDSGQAIAARVRHFIICHNLLSEAVFAEPALPTDDSNHEQKSAKPPLIFYASKYDADLGDLVQR